MIAFLGAGCVSRRYDPKDLESSLKNNAVRKVYLSKEDPELKTLAQRAVTHANELYPRITAILNDGSDDFPDRFDLKVRKEFGPFSRASHLGGRRAAYVRAKTVYVDATWSSKYLNSLSNGGEVPLSVFDQLITHELVHIAQQYSRKMIQEHRHWVEGMADYVCYKLESGEWRCPECSGDYPHYTYGYTCAGAFLLYLDQSYGSRVVVDLHSELRKGSFTDVFFFTATGKSLETLWQEFQGTDYVKPIAKKLYDLQTAIGYKNGKPPRRLAARFDRYIEMHPQAVEVKQMMAFVNNGKWSKEQLDDKMLLFLYLTQPGGSPEGFFLRLLEQNGLPSEFKNDDSVVFSTFLDPKEMKSGNYSLERTIKIKGTKDTNIHHYRVGRESSEGKWKLLEAWLSSEDGTRLKEFSLD
ncbi:MAG: basic secretory protein-like protein [Limisphaerales bacterium]